MAGLSSDNWKQGLCKWQSAETEKAKANPGVEDLGQAGRLGLFAKPVLVLRNFTLFSLEEQALGSTGCSTSLSAAKDTPRVTSSRSVRQVRGAARRAAGARIEKHQPGPASPARSLAVRPRHTCVFAGSQVPRLQSAIIALLCRGAAG